MRYRVLCDETLLGEADLMPYTPPNAPATPLPMRALRGTLAPAPGYASYARTWQLDLRGGAAGFQAHQASVAALRLRLERLDGTAVATAAVIVQDLSDCVSAVSAEDAQLPVVRQVLVLLPLDAPAAVVDT